MAQAVPMHLPDPFPADEGQPNDRAIMEDFLQELASGEPTYALSFAMS
jgi:hypothetical protein